MILHSGVQLGPESNGALRSCGLLQEIKDVSFCRIPKIVTNRGEAIQELSKKRCAGFLSAIMRADLTQKVLSNDRICSRHFI